MKKTAIILFAFFLGISFLKADSFMKDGLFDEFLIPFQNRELYRASADDPLIDSLTAYADRLGERLNGVVLVARHDTILVEKAYGYLELYKSARGYDFTTNEQLEAARNKSSNAMTTNTLFELASVSKQFTAAAVLKLCQEGKMQLTDTLGQYISGTPYSKVTIKQMLSHNSGIPEYFNFNYELYDTTPFITNEQLVEVLKKNPTQWMFKPSQGYSYTNTNYALLASIVSIVSGMKFEQYVRDYLWKPAGMKNTYYFTELVGLYPDRQQPAISVRKGQEFANVRALDGITSSPISRGHFKGGSLAQYDRLNGVLGDKGVYTTAEDLVRWTNTYFIDCKILPKELIAEATKMQNKTSNGIIPKDLYGYGLHLEDKENGYLVYHGGLWNGYHNLWVYRPKDGVQIIYLSNFYNYSHPGQSRVWLKLIDEKMKR